MSELKKCPFCGGKAIWTGRYVQCYDCDIRTDEYSTDYNNSAYAKATAAWNRRTNDWIPVSERLPETSETSEDVLDPDTLAVVDTKYHMVSPLVCVVVIDENGEQFVGDDIFLDGNWCNFFAPAFEVTHWMPLPEPPMEAPK